MEDFGAQAGKCINPTWKRQQKQLAYKIKTKEGRHIDKMDSVKTVQNREHNLSEETGRETEKALLEKHNATDYILTNSYEYE